MKSFGKKKVTSEALDSSEAVAPEEKKGVAKKSEEKKPAAKKAPAKKKEA